MKLLILIGFALLLIECKDPNADKKPLVGHRSDSLFIELNKEPFDSTIEYHTENAVFFLPRREVFYYGQRNWPNLQNRKDLLLFLDSNRNPKLIIADSLPHNVSANNDDFYLKNAVRWATIDILRSGQAHVYDKKAGIFVDSIKFYEINQKYSGWIEIRLPNETRIIKSTVWIR